MAPNKLPVRNWNDVQMAIAAISMSGTLALWNMFAGPDRAEAARKAVEQIQATPVPTETPLALQPAPLPIVKIIFGGASAPQTTVITTTTTKRRSGGGGGGGSTSATSGGTTKTS